MFKEDKGNQDEKPSASGKGEASATSKKDRKRRIIFNLDDEDSDPDE